MTLKEFIYEKGYTHTSFCRRAGICRHTLDSVCQGKVYTKQSSVIPRIATALGINVKDVERMTGSRMLTRHPIEEELCRQNMTIRMFAKETDIPYETIRGIVVGKVAHPRRDTVEWIERGMVCR